MTKDHKYMGVADAIAKFSKDQNHAHEMMRGCQATPREELERQIMSSLVPKNEREHWAAREIESLREQVKMLHEKLTYADLILEKEYNHIVPSIRAALAKAKGRSLTSILLGV